MFCINCGQEITSSPKFCPSCGKEVNQTYKESPIITNQNNTAVVPQEISGWNWGAFLLSWIWGIGNNVWWGLLTLIPYAGFIMRIILGVKGNKWAWKNKKWESIEDFKKTQKTWADWEQVS